MGVSMGKAKRKFAHSVEDVPLIFSRQRDRFWFALVFQLKRPDNRSSETNISSLLFYIKNS